MATFRQYLRHSIVIAVAVVLAVATFWVDINRLVVERVTRFRARGSIALAVVCCALQLVIFHMGGLMMIFGGTAVPPFDHRLYSLQFQQFTLEFSIQSGIFSLLYNLISLLGCCWLVFFMLLVQLTAVVLQACSSAVFVYFLIIVGVVMFWLSV